MATYVLVPGAWLGGWCWQRVTPLLREAGHDVYTPTLTGLGERVHLGTPETDLDTHIQDIVNVLTYEDLRDVVLLGHSYSGMVVTGVADRAPDRLSQLVYLDAVLPNDGQAFFSFGSAEGRAEIEQAARERGDGWRWPFAADLDPTAGDIAPDDLRLFKDKATGQPLKTLSQPVHLTNPAAQTVPRTYIWCSVGYDGLPDYLAWMQNTPGWRFIELKSGHWPMFSQPHALAQALLELGDRG
jgi:pimeloyl-ACP methyl ester carboxylesterase